jgi:poly-beta-1,6-N-acetyl-D-glucosamine synthase
MDGDKFIVITPARNEEKYLGKTIESMLSQTILPCEWMIVDDGSTDETYHIALKASQVHPWIKVIRRPNRGYRDLGSGLIEVFYEGLGHITTQDYQFIFNIDADIFLGPDYFKTILLKFAENPKLGIAGGIAYDCYNDKLLRLRGVPEFVTGALFCWRRECFVEIHGVARGLAWECIDTVKAMMKDWQAQVFEDKELRALHLRPEGSSIKNKYLGWARRGKALWFAGAHPVWTIASAAFHLLSRPYILGSFCIIIGYFQDLLDGAPQYDDPGFRRYLQAWQKQKLASIMRLKWMPGD